MMIVMIIFIHHQLRHQQEESKPPAEQNQTYSSMYPHPYFHKLPLLSLTFRTNPAAEISRTHPYYSPSFPMLSLGNSHLILLFHVILVDTHLSLPRIESVQVLLINQTQVCQRAFKLSDFVSNVQRI